MDDELVRVRNKMGSYGTFCLSVRVLAASSSMPPTLPVIALLNFA